MKSTNHKLQAIVSLTSSLAGIFLLVSIFLNILGLEPGAGIIELFLFPGRLLFEAFFLGSFYIPLFVFGCGFLIASKPFNKRNLGLLVFSILPFMTGSLLLKIVSTGKARTDAVSSFLLSAIGIEASGIILSTLLVLEFFLMWKIISRARSKADTKIGANKAFAEGNRKLEVLHEFKGENNISEKRELILGLNRITRLVAEHEGETAFLKETEDNNKPGLVKDAAKLKEQSHYKSEPARVSKPQSGIIENSEVEAEPHYLTPRRAGDEAESFTPEADPYDAERDSLIEETKSGKKLEPCSRDSAVFLSGKNDAEISSDSDVFSLDEEDDYAPKQRIKSKGSSSSYDVPVDGILKSYADGTYWSIDEETRDAGQILMETLAEFNINAEVTGIRRGPVITMFEILPAPGVKLSKITNLADNIALRLAASRVRIVAPIPGKHAVGIEVPNKKRAIVSFKELITLDLIRSEKYDIPIVIGKDIAGEAQIIDLVQTPHLLIAGATGSGKSVCVNSIICSILYTKSPDEVKLLLIDPKIVELKFYNDIPHLLAPVVTEPKRAFQALQYCLCEMERRYSLLDSLGVRDIASYNRKAAKKKMTIPFIPYIVIIIDEFADLIANTGKDMEATIARLAAMSRAVGIHIVLATQRPSVEVITGLIKANIPSRIAFMVASKFDSRIIIDSVGAEKLLGKGDMLLSPAWDPVPVRIQGAYLAEDEVEAVSSYVKTLGEPDYIDDDIFMDDDEEDEKIEFGENDPLMEKALEIVVTKGKASASYLQRRLKIGYNRAARIVEEMEIRGIVGPANGSKPREIMHVPERKGTTDVRG